MVLEITKISMKSSPTPNKTQVTVLTSLFSSGSLAFSGFSDALPSTALPVALAAGDSSTLKSRGGMTSSVVVSVCSVAGLSVWASASGLPPISTKMNNIDSTSSTKYFFVTISLILSSFSPQIKLWFSLFFLNRAHYDCVTF